MAQSKPTKPIKPIKATKASRTTSSKKSKIVEGPGNIGNRAIRGGTRRLDPRQEARARDLVMELMGIPGPSGEEGRVAEYVRDHLRDAGVPASAMRHDSAHRRARLRGQVGNLIVRLDGDSRKPRRLLTAHLDTVPICVGSRPRRRAAIVRSADPATGLGADNRAGTAVLLATALALLDRRVDHPPLTLCWFVQEEIGLEGSRHVSRSLLGAPSLAFNWDGGDPSKLTIGATGGYRMDVEIAGHASHAGNAPERGVSAIAVAALAIADLQRDGWHGKIVKPDGEGTSNVGVIRGGDATNVVADRVTVRVEARSHAPLFRTTIVERIEGAFREAANAVVNVDGKRGRVAIRGRLDYESFRLADDAPCVRAAEAAARSAGLDPWTAISNGGLDANWLSRHGIPTVTLGCGQVNPHMTTERLDLRQFTRACRMAYALATGIEPADA